MPNRSKREQSPHRDAAAALGRRLRTAREGKRLSQQQLAGLASVAIGTVRALERARSVDPSFFTVLALARALDLDAANLIAAVMDASPVSSPTPSSAAPSSIKLWSGDGLGAKCDIYLIRFTGSATSTRIRSALLTGLVR